MDVTTVIKRPLITEKSVQDAKLGKFTFIVEKSADKDFIKKAIEKKFAVNVIDVATSIMKGRKKRVGAKRTEIDVPIYKKAVVKLKSGQKIELFDIKAE
jgi:large subunit ribosomal protein L23